MTSSGGPEGTRPDRAPAAGFERDPNFIYIVDNRKPRVSDAHVLEHLRTFAATVGGRPFTAAEFDAWPQKPCAAGTISNRFHGWRTALTRAGIEGARLDYDPRELMENLRAIWKKKGRVPGAADMRRYGSISMSPYMRRWGSVRKACLRLARFERGEITSRELLERDREKGTRSLRQRDRWRILERDGHRCRGCGRGAGEVKLEVDHIVPVARGGTDEPSNLRVLCVECNRGKGPQGGRPRKKPPPSSVRAQKTTR